MLTPLERVPVDVEVRALSRLAVAASLVEADDAGDAAGHRADAGRVNSHTRNLHFTHSQSHAASQRHARPARHTQPTSSHTPHDLA